MTEIFRNRSQDKFMNINRKNGRPGKTKDRMER
jgi:hypothetical protein